MTPQEQIRDLQLRSASYSARHRRKAALACQLRLRPLIEKQLKGEIRMDKRERSLIAQMASCLVENGTDLADERHVIRTLNAAEFRGGDIAVCMDRAIESARERRYAFSGPKDYA